MERIATGIPGLDELIEGGFPKGSTILVSGSAGTGKTILSMQYLYEGATKYNERGVFVSLESNIQNLLWNMESFKWNLRELQEKQKIAIYRLRIGEIFEEASIREQITKELDHITEIVKTIDAKRLVVDPTTAFGIWFEKATLRNVLFNFTDKIRELGCTTIMTAETKNRKDEFSAFGVEEFIADGVIALYFFPPHRNMFIRKMRGTNHDKNIHPFRISEKGIEINAKETVLWEALR